jgi:hypothetical protein
MRKKLEELNSIAKARLKLLDIEKAEKVKLTETLNHFKRNLKVNYKYKQIIFMFMFMYINNIFVHVHVSSPLAK